MEKMLGRVVWLGTLAAVVMGVMSSRQDIARYLRMRRM